MQPQDASRRRLLAGALGAVAAGIVPGPARLQPSSEGPDPLRLPEGLPVRRFDFERGALAGWTTVAGRWGVEEMAGAPSGARVLVQRGVAGDFHVVVAPGEALRDLAVSVRFKPISGREDASGGIVFRFAAERYYVVRANALESNFRLYYYDRGRRQLGTASVQRPELGRWHSLRVIAVGDRIQASLNGRLLLDHRDARLQAGRLGLWTKSDSVTAFDDLEVSGVPGGA